MCSPESTFLATYTVSAVEAPRSPKVTRISLS